MSIREFLGLAPRKNNTVDDDSETETVRRIVDELDRLEPDRARTIAAFAYVLTRVAYADREISPEETQAMERAVIEQSGLPEQQAVLVVHIAKSQNILFGSTEDFVVTQDFAEHATREEKLALLNCLFAVSSADLHISTVEDNEIARISKQLRLTHQEFIAARRAFKEHLGVLKPGRETQGK